MWIERIELSNFKAYKNQSFFFPMPSRGKNMVLIGGMNGHGKTTLLEAIYLCLYGEDATHHLARAGLRENAYARFLQAALHGNANSRRDNAMRVLIRIMIQPDFGYEIIRTWYFGPAGRYESQEPRVSEVRDGVTRPLDAAESLPSILYYHVVPAHLAPFFFFDGEEVKKLADQDRSEWIKQGMESLLGVVLVRQLRERLSQYQNNRRQGASALDQTELDRMLADIAAKESEKSKLSVALQKCILESNTKSDLQNSLHERLMTIGAGGGNIKSVEDIIREEGEKKTELDKCEKNLERLLGDRLPFHLISRELHGSLRENLRGERVLVEWGGRKRGLEPEKEKFANRLLSSEQILAFSETDRMSLTNAVNWAWEGLFWPRPSDCAESVLHNYLEERQRQRLEESQSVISVGASQIRQLVKQKADIVQRLKELENRRIQLQGIEDDGSLKKLNDELRAVQSDLTALGRERGDLERQLTSIDASINQARASYERENEKYIRSEPAQSVVRKAGRVISLIDELLPQLFEQKTHELSEQVTKRFKSLAHRNWVNKIEIKPDGRAIIYGTDDQVIRFDRSAGENQIFATALYAGLADVSRYHIPLVVDTPMARLDSQHRTNLLDYWRGDPDRQVILLSQDEEVDLSLAQTLSPYLAKTYLLESVQIEKDIYRTIAKENAYFGGGL